MSRHRDKEADSDYLEDCCWNFTREYCRQRISGGRCACRCHIVEVLVWINP